MSASSNRQEPPAALRRLLGRPALKRLLQAAKAKLERYGTLRGSVRLDSPDAEERRAIADLLGLRTVPPPDQSLRVQLSRLDRVLRQSRFAVSLAEALTLHHGSLRDLPAERAAESEQWQRLWRLAHQHPLILEHPKLVPWLEDLETSGLYRRLAGRGSENPGDLQERVFAVLAELLSDDAHRTDDTDTGDAGTRLAVLANRVLGDSHALDAGHRVPALVLRALAHLHHRPLPLSAAERRELWATAGVICDDLSCDVLALGVAPAGEGLLHRTLRAHAAIGEPIRVTLRQLAGSDPVRLPAPGRVFVCENPAVISVAADRLGKAAPALVCLAGQPDTAALVLLRSLVESGAELHYHGDFDWGGLRIANVLFRTLRFRPWRFTVSDYLQVVEQAQHSELAGSAPPIPLRGNPVDAEWDPELRTAMERRGRVVEEEAVIDELLKDLGP